VLVTGKARLRGDPLFLRDDFFYKVGKVTLLGDRINHSLTRKKPRTSQGGSFEKASNEGGEGCGWRLLRVQGEHRNAGCSPGKDREQGKRQCRSHGILISKVEAGITNNPHELGNSSAKGKFRIWTRRCKDKFWPASLKGKGPVPSLRSSISTRHRFPSCRGNVLRQKAEVSGGN